MSHCTTILSCLLAATAACTTSCSAPDNRSFAVENAIFESLLATPYSPRPSEPTQAPDTGRQAAVAQGLSAICNGDTAGTGELLRNAGIGKNIYRLALIAAKADRKGSCDYTDWSSKQSFLGERFTQLVGSGDGPSVLLAALLDDNLNAADRRAIIEALSGRRYGHAEAAQAALLLRGEGGPRDEGKALELATDGARQGAAPAYLLLADIYQQGLETPTDNGKACDALREAARLGSPTGKDRLSSAGAACRTP